MNIAILSRGNSACGVSLHSELIGREFVKNGNKLTVFAPDVTADEFIKLVSRLLIRS